MKKIWQYLIIQFLNATKHNFKKAVKLSNYHDADLNLKKASEPLLVPIYNRYHLLHQALINEYNAWKSAGGMQEGQTLNLDQLLEDAVKLLPQWEVDVQAAGPAFLKGTPNYVTIFPDGRKPFTTGSLDIRILAFKTLSTNMSPFVPLAALATTVMTTYTNLDGARDAQEGAKGTVKTDSGKVETARVNAMTMQWRDLGFSMDAFWDKPNYIESMFDLTTLRESRQHIFTGTLDPSENEGVLIHTFLGDDKLRLKSNGNATINFYLSNVPNGTNSTPVVVGPNIELETEISAFNVPDYGTYRYLTAVNQSVSDSTQYIVEVL
jgi:hypothetical protein